MEKKEKFNTFHDFTDKQLKDLIRLRLKNEKFDCGTKITKIIIQERRLLSVTADIHNTKYAPEYMIFAAFKKCYANEFILLQKMNFDFELVDNWN